MPAPARAEATINPIKPFQMAPADGLSPRQITQRQINRNRSDRCNAKCDKLEDQGTYRCEGVQQGADSKVCAAKVTRSVEKCRTTCQRKYPSD